MILKKKIKILFSPSHYIFDEYLGGSEPYMTYSVVNRIANLYPESVVITGKKVTLNHKNYRIREVYKALNAKKLDITPINALIFNIRYTLASLQEMRKTKFDIIHHVRPFSIGSTFNLIAVFKLNRQIPFVIGSFASPYKTNPGSLVERNKLTELFFSLLKFTFGSIIKYLSIKTLKNASAVIVYDNYTKELVSHHVTQDKIFIIPPGKDKKLYEKTTERKNADKKILLAVCNLIHRKGLDITINAIADVVRENQTVRLEIVGDGPERIRLEKLTDELGLREYINFVGFVENRNIQKYYKKADLFVHMARQESHAQVYLEALAAGLPIISSENIAYEQILKPNNLGYVVPQEDIKKLSQKISSIIKNESELQIQSKKGFEFFSSYYDWDTVIIKKYMEVYSKVLS